MHTPVLLKETITALNICKGGKYIDATFGEGGHGNEILKRGGRVLAIEWDEGSLKFKVQSLKSQHLKLVWGNFADIEKIAKENNFYPVAGILFDLGLSMEQIEKSGRGFSYKKKNEPLDMRVSSTLPETAADIINNSSAQNLYEIFARNAGEINSWPIAQAIVRAGRLKKLTTVGDLLSIINSCTLKLSGKKESVIRRIFQALRIEVNHEFANIIGGLKGAVNIINREGRIAVITFHQDEDRIIKKFVKDYNLRFLTKKPITSKNGNKFEASAKLRIIIRN